MQDYEMKERISQLEMQLQETRDRELNLRKLNDSLAGALRETEDSKRSIGRREIEILIEKHKEEIQESSKRHNQENKLLIEENSSLRTRIKELESWRKANSEEYETKIDRFQKEISDKNSYLTSLNIKVENLEFERKYTFYLQRELEKRIKELSTASNTYNSLRINELNNEKTVLQDQVNNLSKRLTDISNSYECRTRVYDEKMKELESKLSNVINERDELLSETEALKELLEAKDAEVGFYKNKAFKLPRKDTEGNESCSNYNSILDRNLSLQQENKCLSRRIEQSSPSEKKRVPQVALINLNENYETLETNLSIDTTLRDKFFSPSPRATVAKIMNRKSPKNESYTSRLNARIVENRSKKNSISSRAVTSHSRTKSANMNVSKTPKKTFQARVKPATKIPSENNLQSTAVFGNIGSIECKNCNGKFSFQSFVSHSSSCCKSGSSKNSLLNDFVSILKDKNIPIEHHDDLISKFFQASETPIKGKINKGKGLK